MRETTPTALVGIDVAKHGLDVFAQPAGERWAVARDGGALPDLARRLPDLAPALTAELPEPGRPCRRKLAAPAGVASTGRDGARLRGRHDAPTAAHRHPRERGKVALVARMRELTVTPSATLRDEAPWSPAS